MFTQLQGFILDFGHQEQMNWHKLYTKAGLCNETAAAHDVVRLQANWKKKA